MVKKFLISGLAFACLAGCGQAANDVRLSLARNELRQNCMGNDTYSCRSQTIDFNQKVLELTEFKSDSAKEGITRLFGDKGWELYQEVADEFVEDGIDRLEKMRPNIFARLFFGDSQAVSPEGRILDFYPDDMAEAERAIQKVFAERAKKAGLQPDQRVLQEYAGADKSGHGTAPAEPTGNATAPSGYADLTAAIDAYIATLDNDGGGEYLEGRQVLQVDLNDDGQLDAAVVFTIEGAGGSQMAYQTLTAFYHTANGWQARGGDATLSGSVRGIRAESGRTIFVDAVVQGDDDPRCCPSEPFPQRYQWNGEGFVQVPGANG